MKTELTRDDLLKNISSTREKLEDVKRIEDQIAELYKEPVTNVQKKMIASTVNLAWILVFGIIAFKFPGYHLIVMPFLYWFFRGSKVSDRITKNLYKKQLDENENMIDALYVEKEEKDYTLKTISMLEEEFHDVAMLKQFETYLKTKQAVTIEKCMELYNREQKKQVVKK